MHRKEPERNKMKAVFLDYKDINIGDLSWAPLEELCSLEVYETTPAEETAERIGDAEIVFMDSAAVSREVIESCPNLKYIGIAATGFNHIDLKAAEERGIAVTNVPAYSTSAVSQHAISLLLNITNKISRYDNALRESVADKAAGGSGWDEISGEYFNSNPLTLLEGKTIGIIGYGNIGRRVAAIAETLGMKVNIYSRDREAAIKSDVVSMHCPLDENNRGMINEEFIEQMKDGAIFINTARGGLVDEEALAKALNTGKIAFAGLDVTQHEPPQEDCPLLKCENCIITPHMAFMPKETRSELIERCADNLRSFTEGKRLNRLV